MSDITLFSYLDLWDYLDKNIPVIAAFLSFPAKNLHNVHLMFFCTETKRGNAGDPGCLPCYSTRVFR